MFTTPSKRPRFSDFQERLQKQFSVSTLSGGPLGFWVLQDVRGLPSPDAEELRDLECFSLTFDCATTGPLNQGCYLFEEGSFRATLFAVPDRGEKMIVTIS